MGALKIVAVLACLAVAICVVLFGNAVQNDWLFRACTLAMLAVSWNLMANAGLVSLGHSAFWGVGSYATVLSMNAFSLPFGIGFIPAIIAGALVGAFLAATTGRLRGIFFAISTLALSEGLRVLALMTPELTGGAAGVFLKNSLRPPQWALYSSALVGAVACVLIAYLLSRSRFHYACRGMRADESVVQMLGVDPRRYRLGVMIISGAMASCAGAINASYSGYLEPELGFSLHFTILSQIAPILGGIHTLAGPVIGAVAIIFISEVTRIWAGTREGWSVLVYGSILVLCIMFMRNGFVGVWRDTVRLVANRRRRPNAVTNTATGTVP
jgi:branched-chain amino acid transport system permease protein